MSSAQKVPYARSAPLIAQKAAADLFGQRGIGSPGHVVAVDGAIVTINFDVTGVTLNQVKMPVAMSQYIRDPIQPGDLGVALPAGLYLGGVSGLGGGIADTTLRGSLSTLIWFPTGNINWAAVPSGVVLDSPSVTATGNLNVANGASGVFTTPTGDTVTVQNGIIINIA